MRRRQARGLTTTSTNVTNDRDLKDRTSSYRILKSLIDKGLIQNYAGIYYKLVEQTEKEL